MEQIRSRRYPIVPIFVEGVTMTEGRLEYVKSLRGLEPTDDPIKRLAEYTLAQFMGMKRGQVYEEEMVFAPTEAEAQLLRPPTDIEWEAAEELSEYVHSAVCRFIVESIDSFIDKEREDNSGQN